MKEYKIGDKVKIKSEKWVKDNQDLYSVKISPAFVSAMYGYCGKDAIITEIQGDDRYSTNLSSSYNFCSDFFESDCEFCNGKCDDINLNGVHISLSGKNMIVDNKSFEIEYCPFCGNTL